MYGHTHLCVLKQFLGAVWVFVPQKVLAHFEQVLWYVVVDGQVAGIDDSHVHPSLAPSGGCDARRTGDCVQCTWPSIYFLASSEAKYFQEYIKPVRWAREHLTYVVYVTDQLPIWLGFFNRRSVYKPANLFANGSITTIRFTTHAHPVCKRAHGPIHDTC